jgi:hypothetical protein
MKCLPLAFTNFTCIVRTDVAMEKVEKSIDLIETNDGHNYGHNKHNNKPIDAKTTQSKSIHICCVYALI